MSSPIIHNLWHRFLWHNLPHPWKASVQVVRDTFRSVCLKAVHLEFVSDFTSDSFLLAFQKFVTHRGFPVTVHCDNATNFVEVDRHMKEFRDRLEEQVGGISDFASKKGCELAFIPPRAPHFGGIWKASVKSAKHLFLRTVGTAHLTAEELGTLLAIVEEILNS